MHLGHLLNDFVYSCPNGGDIKIVQGHAESRACCQRVVLRSSLRSLIRSKAVVEPGASGVDMIQLLFDIAFDTVTGEIGFSPKINVLKLNSRFWTH
jgi:hypothetical protein